MTKVCSYCLNSPRLATPPGVIEPDDHTKFDCPVCQENRVVNEFGETDLLVHDEDEEFDEPEFNEDDFEEEFFDDDEEYEEEDEDYDQF